MAARVELRMILLLVVALHAPAGAAVPDCTGVSPVFNTDSDLVGQLTAHPIAVGLESPVFATSAPGDTTRLFVVEQAGRIRIVKDGSLLAMPFLDIDPDVGLSNEEGLLGLAFHPAYETNGWFFVYYTKNDGNNVVARFSVSADPDVADPGSRVEVITISHPTFANHNGGMIAFNPLDGRLYIGIGDGGGSCDSGPGTGNAQNLDLNLGKLLRLDVDSLPASTAGNPYDGSVPGNDEIWSRGLRNPWRWSFDRETGALYIGDVGEALWEEIDCRPASSIGGENYGWPFYEGSHCPNPSCGPQGSCAVAGYVPPIRSYGHGPPCVVAGGYVYRGCRMAALSGTYFYADVCTNVLNSFRTDGSCFAAPDIERISDLVLNDPFDLGAVVSFGEDQRGELYIVSYSEGEVFKILPDLSIMEVSGPGAPSLVFEPAGDMSWEDLEPDLSWVQSYKVYRSTSGPVGPFLCVKLETSTTWTGGDTELPASGAAFYYLVTARTAEGVESTAGARSDGTLRVVSSGSPCPP